MADNKHTPLPWYLDKLGLRVLAAGRVKKTPQHPEFIVAQCSAYCGQGTGIPGYAEQKANAALICATVNAAPHLAAERNEMLALLDMIADSLVMIDPNRFVLELNAEMRNEIVAAASGKE